MSIISAGNTSTTSLVHTGDTSGNLVFQTNGNITAATFDTNQNATFANNVTVTGVLNANIAGNGSTLTNINASNITSGTISNAYTTANSSNVASAIVLRDEVGAFSAGAITGAYFIGDGSNVSAINASNISSGTIDNARTSAASANGASTIVARDTNGSFAANVVTATSGSFTNVSGNGATLTSINASNIASGTISNSLTTASSANGANTIVLRDANGSFATNDITANVVSGNSGSFTAISGNGVGITAINASNISSGVISNLYTTADSANGASTIVSRDSNGSFTANAGTFTSLSGNLTGNVTLTTGTITTNAANATDIANKAYVDGLFSTGISYHAPVRVESPTALTVTYNQPNGAGNGVGATLTNAGTQQALVIDGVTLSVNDRVLVYTQTNQVQNGIYTVTNVGSGSTNWVMTRATDADTYGLADPNKLSQGDAFFVEQGSTGAGETYVCNTPGTITFGTTNITFAQISTSQVYSAGTGLALNNLTFSLANTAVTAGTYDGAGNTFSLTVNAQGQLTSVSTVPINASSITVGTLPNNRTTADSANGASTIVARDANGSFSANAVSATTGSFTNVSGNGFGLTAINASNITSGILSASLGGTGQANLTANNVILGNGANAVQLVAPGTNGNVLTSNGTTWISAAASGGVTSITGTANQIIASSSTGAITLSTPQSINTASSVQFGSFGVGTAASGTTGEIRATNNITAFYSSDERLKDNVKVITGALEKVQAIRGVEFDWNNLKEPEDGYFVRKHDVGVIAQEVEKVLPEVVGTREDGIKAVKYDRIVPLLIEAIKELKAEVDALKGR